jgi:hypothetical protein
MSAFRSWSGAIAVALTSSWCLAGTVTVDSSSLGSITLNSGTLNNVFGNNPTKFTWQALKKAHNQLNNAGISTEGMVTIVLADTDAGLSLLALVDDENGPPGNGKDTTLSVNADAPSDSMVFVNSLADEADISDDGSSMNVDMDFFWDSEKRGDAVAWAGLGQGDEGDFSFEVVAGEDGTFQGLNESNTFQFVSFGANGWEVVANGSFLEGVFGFDFAFSGSVVPIPPAALLGFAGLAGVALLRRSR